MIGFQTASSTYYVDTVNRTICGGKLGNHKRRYAVGAQFIIGMPGVAYFVDEWDRPIIMKDGRQEMIKTGAIRNYI